MNTHTNPSQIPQAGVVVIGGGTAGWTIIETLRKLDATLDITLITADSGDRYIKPQLSAAFSQNKTAATLINKTAESLATTLNITLLAHTIVTSIDSHAQTITSNHGVIGYHRLILATGAVPVLPANLPCEHTWQINHIDDFDKLQRKLATKPNQHIAIIGAGMIGVELAEDLSRAGHRITLIGRDQLPLLGVLPPIAAARLHAALTDISICYLGDTHIQSIHPEQEQYRLSHTNGKLVVDEIITSTGLMLDKTLAASAEIDHSQHGIIVNPTTLQSSNPAIYAIGDCISIYGKPCRFVAVLREQASAIAHHILGLDHTGYQHKPPMIRLKNKAITVSITGEPTPQAWHIDNDDESLLLLSQRIDDTITAKIELKAPSK